LAARGDQLFLLGRDLDDLRRTADDLQIRGALDRPPGVGECDLRRPATFDPSLAAARDTLAGLDAVVVTAGAFATQETLETDTEQLAVLLNTNFTNTVLFCEAARKRLLKEGGGKLVVFSSVAGDRARKPVVLYGASKAGLSAYLEGLDHRFRRAGLQTICVKPGFVRTGMTEGLPAPPFAGDPDQVAGQVVRAMDRGTPVVYTPGIWRWILFVIRRLPRFVMRRIGF
jgi:NAD(P)-dependent dehydrogenase (short-subunit alcohol dehydrogenase family)